MDWLSKFVYESEYLRNLESMGNGKFTEEDVVEYASFFIKNPELLFRLYQYGYDFDDDELFELVGYLHYLSNPKYFDILLLMKYRGIEPPSNLKLEYDKIIVLDDLRYSNNPKYREASNVNYDKLLLEENMFFSAIFYDLYDLADYLTGCLIETNNFLGYQSYLDTACVKGYLNLVKYCISKGADISLYNYSNFYSACVQNHPEVVKYILTLPIDMNVIRNKILLDILLYCVNNNLFDILKILLDNFDNINYLKLLIVSFQNLTMFVLIIKYLPDNYLSTLPRKDVEIFFELQSYTKGIEQIEILIKNGLKTYVPGDTDLVDKILNPMYYGNLELLNLMLTNYVQHILPNEMEFLIGYILKFLSLKILQIFLKNIGIHEFKTIIDSAYSNTHNIKLFKENPNFSIILDFLISNNLISPETVKYIHQQP